MAITRYHAPYVTGDLDRLPMEQAKHGDYVKFREYDQKTKHLQRVIQWKEEEIQKLHAEILELRFPEEASNDGQLARDIMDGALS